MTGNGKRMLLVHNPEPTHLPRAARLEQEGCGVVQAHEEVQALCERQSRRLDPVVPLLRESALPSIISYSITCNLSVLRTVLETEQVEASMDRGDRHRARHEAPRICSAAARAFFCMASIRGLLLVLLLAGCQSTQDVYLAQATDHATAVELEQALGHPSYEQALDTGQRRWLYHQDGGWTGGREFTPSCQDLWLTFDRDGVLHTWEKQRC